MGKFNFSVCKNIQEVDVSKWTEQEIYVREFTGQERTKAAGIGNKEANDLYADLILMAATDEEGNPLFEESERDNIKTLPGKMIDKIILDIYQINGLTENAIQETAENFTPSQSDDSPIN